jgi:citrate lyase beta subunit
VHPAVELMIETPQALAHVREIVDAADGRCRGAHFGPYDFTSACGVTTQDLRHRLCIHARAEMCIRLASAGVWLSDGPTAVLPIGTVERVSEAWQLSWHNISEALADGFHQGWDVHPAQLPVRYAAVYDYFAKQLPAAVARYQNFMQQSEQATRVGSVFDDAASVLILRNLFRQALACGAITAEELRVTHGITLS